MTDPRNVFLKAERSIQIKVPLKLLQQRDTAIIF